MLLAEGELNGSQVRHHKALVAPLVPQLARQQGLAGAGRDPVNFVVGTHHASCAAGHGTLLKGWQVGVSHVPAGQMYVDLADIAGLQSVRPASQGWQMGVGHVPTKVPEPQI